MAKIHVLSEHLTNMIAAGEVVERPAGIVKECVENSIDAGATVIEVEVFQGGIERIVITDDGCGMDHEDAHLAFMRHATSKMHSEEELFNIQTMGFRGEALPSIASVAQVEPGRALYPRWYRSAWSRCPRAPSLRRRSSLAALCLSLYPHRTLRPFCPYFCGILRCFHPAPACRPV